MSRQIISLQEWFQTPPGQYLLGWEQARHDHALADVFGYHALQLGLPAVPALRANRMPHQWLADEYSQGGANLQCDFAALPFAEHSLDLVVLPHTLELCAEPHATLREVARVLVPEGRVAICGLNPASLWGLRLRRDHAVQRLGLPLGQPFLPVPVQPIGYWRLRDWLRLLGFEVESGSFGCYRPAVSQEPWLRRYRWMDKAGDRWWPILGASYFLVAVKRVRGMRLLGPAWRTRAAAPAASLPLANRAQGKAERGTLTTIENGP